MYSAPVALAVRGVLATAISACRVYPGRDTVLIEREIAGFEKERPLHWEEECAAG